MWEGLETTNVYFDEMTGGIFLLLVNVILTANKVEQGCDTAESTVKVTVESLNMFSLVIMH